MSDPTIEMAVTVVVAGFALAFLRDAWCALRGASSGQTAGWVDASRSVSFRARRPGSSEL